jgi:L-ascorbate metabolism protein UlaG (beta-lactamase superfamily)
VKRVWKHRWKLAGAFAIVVVGAVWAVNGMESLGAPAKGERLERMKRSPNYDVAAGIFVNKLPRLEDPDATDMWDFYIAPSDAVPEPEERYAVQRRRGEEFSTPPDSGLRVTWLGHSTTLIELDGRRFLVDPVWAERASPVSFLGAKRFHEPPLPIDELPAIDVVLISHDHYDHLDHEAIGELLDKARRFAVPLGVGAHLERWGVPADRIDELDWWDSFEDEGIELVMTPARHFSGRKLVDWDATLWAGWAIVGPRHRVYYSGDTALFPELKQIGERYGPFDITIIEAGMYNQAWADSHVGPEQALIAHRWVRGRIMLPVHWGTFNIALHTWTEPPERLLAAAPTMGVDRLALPPPGGSVDVAGPLPTARWWPSLPWQTVEESPCVSSGMERSRADEVPVEP